MIRRAKDLPGACLDGVAVRVRNVDGISSDIRADRTVRLQEQQGAKTVRQVALTLGQGRHCRDTHSRNQLSRALIVSEEERLVLNNRTTDHEAKLIAPEDRLSSGSGRE